MFSVENISIELLTAKYKESCERHNTNPLYSVLNQIKSINTNLERNECLDLKGVLLTNVDWESLEEIFKRVQFKTINVEATGLNDDVRQLKCSNIIFLNCITKSIYFKDTQPGHGFTILESSLVNHNKTIVLLLLVFIILMKK